METGSMDEAKAGADSSSGGQRAAAGQHPVDVPDSLAPQPVTMDEIGRAQRSDEFATMMVKRCAAGRRSDDRAAKFEVHDGVLYRATKADDPREGLDNLRIYVPPVLRTRLINNHHATVWAGHKHAASVYKDMLQQYYESSRGGLW